MFLLIIISLLVFFTKESSETSCIFSEEFPTECMCNNTHCDNVTKVDWCPAENDLNLYITSESGDRLEPSKTWFNDEDSTNNNADLQFTITINPCLTYQTIFGFGGGLSDSAALLISCLPENAKKFLLDGYFDCEHGLAYNIIRFNFGTCDFSKTFYTYCDSESESCGPDQNLDCFQLPYYDTDFKIPIIKLAQSISCKCIHLYGSVYNAPAWMVSTIPTDLTPIVNLLPKQSQAIITRSPISFLTSFNKTILKEGCYKAWADYNIRAIKEFQFCNNPNCTLILSAGYEPILSLSSVTYTNLEEYRKYVTYFLCPALKAANCPNVKLIAHDDQTQFLPIIQQLMMNPETRSCIDGVATHWYFDFDPALAKPFQDKFHEQYPEKLFISSETAICNYDPGYKATDWQKAERYAKDIIQKLLAYIQSYLDWNLALKRDGGPNRQKNFCYSPIVIDCERKEFYRRILFYVLGHFSKFLPEGSIRIECTLKMDSKIDLKGLLLEELYIVGFKVFVPNCKRPNVVLIILNTNSKELKGKICIGDDICARIAVPGKSIMTTVSLVPCSVKCD